MKIVTFSAAVVSLVSGVIQPDCYRVSTPFGD